MLLPPGFSEIFTCPNLKVNMGLSNHYFWMKTDICDKFNFACHGTGHTWHHNKVASWVVKHNYETCFVPMQSARKSIQTLSGCDLDGRFKETHAKWWNNVMLLSDLSGREIWYKPLPPKSHTEVKYKVPSLEVELTAPAENTIAIASCTDSIHKNLGLTGSGGQLLCNPPTLFIPIFKPSVRVKVKSCLEFRTPWSRVVWNSEPHALPLSTICFWPLWNGECVALLQCAQDESFNHSLMFLK